MGNATGTVSQANVYAGGGELGLNQVPIVYDPAYNVRFYGLQRLHPFDSCKYEKILLALINNGCISTEQFISPGSEITREELLEIHTEEYLDSLTSSATVAEICELPPISMLPQSTVESHMLVPMRTAVKGTVIAGEIAYRNGWCVNLGGGMHHASSEDGGGWCVYSDIFLSFHNLRKKSAELVDGGKRVQTAMIIDLDVHQGNGLALDKAKFHKGTKARPSDVYILDMFNHELWPASKKAAKLTNQRIDVTAGMEDEEYLGNLEVGLATAFAEFPRPDIIYYNAGTDVLEGDPLNGGVLVTRSGVARRDAMVFQAALGRDIPIVMVLSGGYATDSATAVWESLTNLIQGELGIIRRLQQQP